MVPKSGKILGEFFFGGIGSYRCQQHLVWNGKNLDLRTARSSCAKSRNAAREVRNDISASEGRRDLSLGLKEPQYACLY